MNDELFPQRHDDKSELQLWLFATVVLLYFAALRISFLYPDLIEDFLPKDYHNFVSGSDDELDDFMGGSQVVPLSSLESILG